MRTGCLELTLRQGDRVVLYPGFIHHDGEIFPNGAVPGTVTSASRRLHFLTSCICVCACVFVSVWCHISFVLQWDRFYAPPGAPAKKFFKVRFVVALFCCDIVTGNIYFCF